MTADHLIPRRSDPMAIDPATDHTDDFAGAHAVHVVDLTDEEILGLDGPGSDQVAPLPWLGDRSEEETSFAAEIGLRSLVTHGRVDADATGVTVPDRLGSVLALRHDPVAIVYADHSTPSTQETRVLYIHPHAVLTEAVHLTGIHRFEVGDLDEALDALGDWCVPARHTGTEDRLEGEGLPAELAGLQSAVCLDAAALDADGRVDTRSLTFYRLADGDVVEGVESIGGLDLPPVDDAGVRRRVSQLVRDALGTRTSLRWPGR